ncbi:50S ribosomal protein L17 [Rhodohalobacter sp. 8-1]|uniref:50S ribosomal protein L17 n=1 Tax=Rhodohalobacter sp. 8-1 TaxID=3131972 RepID=UPI00403FB034
MRHLVKGKKLGRSTSHRKATMKALACSLIEHKSIQTTVTKAKELRRYIEPIITKAKVDSSHTRRRAFSSLQDKSAVNILFDDIIPEVGDRPGGYTRVLKLGFRLGDSAEMALIELVDFSDYEPEKKSSQKKRTRRAGKSNKPTTSEEEAEAAKAESESKDSEASSSNVVESEKAVEKEEKKVDTSDEVSKEAEESTEVEEKEDVTNQAEEAPEEDADEKENKK